MVVFLSFHQLGLHTAPWVDGLLGHPLSSPTAQSTFPLSALMAGSICSIPLSDLSLLCGLLSLLCSSMQKLQESKTTLSIADTKAASNVVKLKKTP